MRFLIILLVMAAAVAQADTLRVEQAAGRVLVQADAARLAAWRLDADTLAVVVPGAAVSVGDLPKGVAAEKVAQGGLDGVVVNGVKGPWEVVQDGRDWLLRPGSTPVPAQSALLLKDGWRIGEDVVKPQDITVGGVAWNVAPLNHAVSVGGSVVGAVRKAGSSAGVVLAGTAAPEAKVPVQTTAKAEAKSVPEPKAEPVKEAARDEPVAAQVPVPEALSNTLQPVDLNTMLARGTVQKPAAAPGLPDAPTGLLAKPKTVAAATDDGGLKFTLTRAEPLRALAFPHTAGEILPMDLSDIYIPGTLVSLTVPEGLRLPPVRLPEEQEVSMVAAPVEASASVVEKVSATPVEAKPVEQAAAEEPVKAPEEVAASDDKEPENAQAEEAESGSLEAEGIQRSRLIPAREGRYFDGVASGWQAIAEAPEGSERVRAARLRLAGFYLAWERPEEAQRVLAAMRKRASDNLPAAPLARLYWGLAELARRKMPPVTAFDQTGPLEGHAKMWRAVRDEAREDFGAALKEWPKERGLLPEYPAYLRELAQLAQATALVQVGDRQVATRVLDQLADGYADGGAVPPALVRLQGLVRLGTKDEAHGLELLAQASEDKRDPATAFRAKYEFVMALQRRHELSDEQVIKYLNDLRYDWRGDALERDVLRTLAGLYEKNGDAREALRTWQVLVNSFPNASDLNEATARMTDAFLRIFDPENPNTYDPLTYLGLYYDFRELVPNTARGDAVQEQVGRLLSDLTLYERALPVLQQQLDYRPLDPAAQGRLALMVAEDNRQMGDAAESLKVLDKWHKVATTTALARGWKVEEARDMLVLKRPDAAKKAVAGLPQEDAEVRDIRIAADWQGNHWQAAVPNLLSKLSHVGNDEMAKSTDAQLALFQLAYAYGQLGDAGKLDGLARQYAPVLGQLPQLADDLGAVAAGTGLSATVVVAGPLAPLTTAMVDLNRLTERMRKARVNLKEDQERQREYNDKMRYMDLLPPPVM